MMIYRPIVFFSAVQARVKPVDETVSAVSTPAVVPSRASWTPGQAAARGFTTLADLATVASGGTSEGCTFLCSGTTRDKLVATGASIATYRGSNDALLIYGGAIAFMDSAPASLRTLVRCTREVVCAGVYAAVRAEANDEVVRLRRIDRRINAKAVQADLSGAMSMASRLCAQLSDTLLFAAGGDRTLRAQIQAAATPAAQGQIESHRGAALLSLVSIGDRMLQNKDPKRNQEFALVSLDREFLNTCRTVAEEANAAVAQNERLLAYGPNAQAETDYWDGVNFYIMCRVARAFAAAHAIDARVPKLMFDKLKKRVSRKGKKAEAAKPKNAADTTAHDAQPANAKTHNVTTDGHVAPHSSVTERAANTDGHTTQSKVA
jgi:hypothetical protein